MKAKDVKIGARYVARVSGNLTTVTVYGKAARGGFNATNSRTCRHCYFKAARRLSPLPDIDQLKNLYKVHHGLQQSSGPVGIKAVLAQVEVMLRTGLQNILVTRADVEIDGGDNFVADDDRVGTLTLRIPIKGGDAPTERN